MFTVWQPAAGEDNLSKKKRKGKGRGEKGRKGNNFDCALFLLNGIFVLSRKVRQRLGREERGREEGGGGGRKYLNVIRLRACPAITIPRSSSWALGACQKRKEGGKEKGRKKREITNKGRASPSRGILPTIINPQTTSPNTGLLQAQSICSMEEEEGKEDEKKREKKEKRRARPGDASHVAQLYHSSNLELARERKA